MKSQVSIEVEIEKVLTYFEVFKYPPTFDEIFAFLHSKISRSKLTEYLTQMEKLGQITSYKGEETRFSLTNKSTNFEQFEKKRYTSLVKIASAIEFFRVLTWFPYFRFVGISGSLSMLNGSDLDDIDICIITQPKRLWTARLVASFVALALGKKRFYGEKKAKDKLCLNLFFDVRDLDIPIQKRNEYIAHELLQLSPVIDRNNTYNLFLAHNEWITDFFPNVKMPKTITLPKKYFSFSFPFFGDVLEWFAKQFQMISIRKRTTTELITPTQLWFFPDDFEKKLKKKISLQQSTV